ncbi:MAG: DNA polymerase III subunit delta [Candidatus Acidiferrales bacterium]
MAPKDVQGFLSRIAKGETIPAILLLGSDSYLRGMCRSKLIEAYLPAGTRDWALARFDAGRATWDEVYERAQTLPMLSPRQLIFVEDAELWQDLDEDSIETLTRYLKDPAPFTVLVFEAATLDQRRTLFKRLSEKTLTVDLSVDEKSAALLAIDMAREFGADLDPSAADMLSDILDAKVASIRTEVEKLAAYAGGRLITTEDVESLVVSAKKYTVWQLADLLATRQRDAALIRLDSLLREGEMPPAMVGALAYRYRLLIEAKELPANQAAGHLRMPFAQAQEVLQLLRKIPREHLVRGLSLLYEADDKLKSGFKDDNIVMEFLMSSLMDTAGAVSK